MHKKKNFSKRPKTLHQKEKKSHIKHIATKDKRAKCTAMNRTRQEHKGCFTRSSNLGKVWLLSLNST